MSKNSMKINPQVSRRKLLVWSVPTVAAISLPLHAQTSSCVAVPPLLRVLVPPKCSGVPPIGEASLVIEGGNTSDIEISNITFSSPDPGVSFLDFPVFPAILSGTSSFEIMWVGPVSDVTSCSPMSAVSLTISYGCVGQTVVTETYDVAQLLLDSIV